MAKDVLELEQMVVTGTTTSISSVNAANAVTTINGSEVNEVPAPTIENALQGRIPGAVITTNSGAPGGVMSAFGMFNALVMSYSRLPLAMAQDGLLPAVFGKLQRKTQAPWVAILFLASCWALCLGLGFERLITIDVLLYGMSLMLEFVALIVLRIKEPGLRRPFKVPGGLGGAVLIGVFPLLLLGFWIVHGEGEQILGISGLAFGLLLIAAGFVVYWATAGLRRVRWSGAALKDEQRGRGMR